MDGSLQRNRRRSGYEPSDTETDWQESPRREIKTQPSDNAAADYDFLKRHDIGTPRRRHSKSPYRPRGETDAVPRPDLRRNASPLSRRTLSDRNLNISPFLMSERRPKPKCSDTLGNACPYTQSERRINTENDRKASVSPFAMYDRRRHFDADKAAGEYFEVNRGRERASFSRRAASAPRARLKEHKKDHRKLSPLPDIQVSHGPSVGEINEMVANAKKMSNGMNGHAVEIESTDSISPGDIFFSRDYNAFQKNSTATRPRELLPKPPGYVDATAEQPRFNVNARRTSQSTTNSTSGVSRQSSNISDASTKTSASARKFIANRRKTHSDVWFSCIKKGSCKKSNKSPEKDRPFDEASFISKAVVVESLRPLWADKHRPTSLSGFTCHKQETLLLQKIAIGGNFPHILMKGPRGTGKKALIMALLHEIYGESVSNMSHDLRYFHIMEPRPMQVVLPVTSSPHHVELNVYSEPKAAYALTALVKKISSEHAVPPEISVVPLKADYKVLVLYDVDKATENMQHLIKWIMDCYSDSCKLVLSCEDDIDILESVRSRCKVIEVEPLVTHEVMEVLFQIANKEGLELSRSFASKIATKSRNNLRKAIMALEACKAHNYPFAEDQPIPLGWEEAIVELAADILADPLPKRLFIVREKIQKLLADFVHPRLILLKLVEQFLRGIEASLKRDVYYWYAYYDKKLPLGMSALLKLEEFVAKFMSIYRKGSSSAALGRQF